MKSERASVESARVKRTEDICIVLFFAFTICIYAPLSIYCANADGYWYTFRLIWYVPLVTFMVVGVMLILALRITRGKLHDIISAVIFGLGLCMYLQGNFLHLTVGIFDGFEFYDNFSSEHNSTSLSVPCSIVIGKPFHNEKIMSQWIEEMAQNRLYFDELVE